MTLNKSVTIFAAIAIIAIIIMISNGIKMHTLRNELDITRHDLKKKDKQIKLKIDSLEAIRSILKNREQKWVLIMSARKDSLKTAQIQANYWKKKYQDEKNTPVTHYTPAELDSVISSIIR